MGFLKTCRAGGVKLQAEESNKEHAILIEEFAYSLADVVSRITSEKEAIPLFSARYDGLLILIDGADKATLNLDLGSFFKQLTERLQRRGCNKVIVGLIGLPDIRNILLASHPSSLRIFEELVLGRLSAVEVSTVIDVCLEKANEENEEMIEIDDRGRETLIAFSEGYPHFIQQFGFSAFATDIDNIIDGEDVFKGALGQYGALEIIGDRYYRNNFYNRIQKDSYRQVLRIMADHYDHWVTKKEIRSKFKGKGNDLDYAI